MTYADLIKLLEPYADQEVHFVGYGMPEDTEVIFISEDSPFLQLKRRWGKDEVKVKITKQQ